MINNTSPSSTLPLVERGGTHWRTLFRWPRRPQARDDCRFALDRSELTSTLAYSQSERGSNLDEASAVRLRMECERRSVASGLADRLRRQRPLVANAMLTNKSFTGVRAPTTAEQRERASRTSKEAIDRARQEQMDFLCKMYERAKDRGGGLGSGLDEVEEVVPDRRTRQDDCAFGLGAQAGVVLRQKDPAEAARQSAKKREAIRTRRATAPLSDRFIYPQSTRPAAHCRRANFAGMQSKAAHASRKKKFATFLDQAHGGNKDPNGPP
ncbi:BQ5605_C059g12714 [Microbotryum silenes-dioicae]|uniref:BQ5605_C059g12714 protein n=1 Tax=Microbotryum silenes-dioicae TaxID=796604 RepID=A0A2X0NG81_9BASI|nr:BQ5605_C059g12714 [Microbotryum silenes-dioicae]